MLFQKFIEAVTPVSYLVLMGYAGYYLYKSDQREEFYKKEYLKTKL